MQIQPQWHSWSATTVVCRELAHLSVPFRLLVRVLKGSSRPVISINATHLYGKYKGKLLIAMATDANNEVYPLAFAVVESESKETWGWFLACLKRFVTDQTNLCIISDRHSGIKACFDDISMTWLQPPQAHHRYYLCHVASNANTKWKISKLKNLVWRAASANQVRKF